MFVFLFTLFTVYELFQDFVGESLIAFDSHLTWNILHVAWPYLSDFFVELCEEITVFLEFALPTLSSAQLNMNEGSHIHFKHLLQTPPP